MAETAQAGTTQGDSRVKRYGVRRNIAQKIAESEPRDVDASMIRGVLTSREMSVAIRLVDGVSSKEIARELQISVKTVDTHRGHILEKLNTRNNVTLTLMFLRAGIREL